jgi:hypothetical protein
MRDPIFSRKARRYIAPVSPALWPFAAITAVIEKRGTMRLCGAFWPALECEKLGQLIVLTILPRIERNARKAGAM